MRLLSSWVREYAHALSARGIIELIRLAAVRCSKLKQDDFVDGVHWNTS